MIVPGTWAVAMVLLFASTMASTPIELVKSDVDTSVTSTSLLLFFLPDLLPICFSNCSSCCLSSEILFLTSLSCSSRLVEVLLEFSPHEIHKRVERDSDNMIVGFIFLFNWFSDGFVIVNFSKN